MTSPDRPEPLSDAELDAAEVKLAEAEQLQARGDPISIEAAEESLLALAPLLPRLLATLADREADQSDAEFARDELRGDVRALTAERDRYRAALEAVLNECGPECDDRIARTCRRALTPEPDNAD